VICLCSFVILGLLIRFYKSEIFSQEGGLETYASTMFYILISFFVITVLTAVLGFCAAKCDTNRIPAFIYGILLFIVCIVFMVFGFTLSLLSTTSESTITSFCAGEESTSMYADSLQGYLSDINGIITGVVDENMCRQGVCPCPKEHQQLWLSLSEERVQEYKRTKSQADTDDTDGDIRLYFIDGTPEEPTYNSFKECYAAISKTAEASATTENYKELSTISGKESSLKLLEYMEKTYSCSGVCKPGLFYYSQPVSSGVPT